MEENILCAICSENIPYSESTVWFTREHGDEVLICDGCCDMLDFAEGTDELCRKRAVEYLRRKIDIYMDEDVAALLEGIIGNSNV